MQYYQIGYRTQNPPEFIKALTGTRLARMFVNAGGNICIEWVTAISDGSYATGNYWFDIALDFEL